jgi:small-conductance mechanosensitive channel
LLEWRTSIGAEYGRVLRSLLLRVFGILVALGFVFLLSEVWRRATYRYIRDTRRRRQLMLIRRVVTGFLMAIVVAMGFISEFSSLATFAGFITAGIAVALQSVILSVAAYFFLIGRYGVRVGDRITVSGVTGDVIDVGLVRLYLLELSGTGIDLYPTGRVVVFSNSVMFQAAPFFKQLPGTAYAWHEVAVTLAPGADSAVAEKSLMDAVNSVYEGYRAAIDHQHSLVERILDTTIASPTPKAHLQFAEKGLEFTVRYPVEIPHAADIDDKMTRKLMEVINGNPELKAAVAGSPMLRAPIRA